ncbi:MAG: tRNA uridine-5-carboxymethylaminomethyl(34) synthesis GTPase MnmE [Pseudomonadota bacterium]
MSMAETATIFALASAPGQAGVAVIRVSGPAALDSYFSLTGADAPPTARHATYRKLSDPDNGRMIDQAIAVYFKAPASYTGEDVIEYSLHGSRAVITKMLEVLGRFPTHRMAEPGEFTKRAFTNGKLDLTAAEAVGDLIHAETEAQRILALGQLEGALEQLYHRWADALTRMLAHQEAEIEFPDEDMPEGIDDAVRDKINLLMDDINSHLQDNRRGERMRTGMQIAIIGAPNAGKSSLLNTLARREAAIVSDIAGTTRDLVEVSLNLGGYPVVICDTAGLRDRHADKVEAEGIRRAIGRAREADLKIALFDATRDDLDPSTQEMVDDKTLVVLNKIDQLEGDLQHDFSAAFEISVTQDQGIPALLHEITARVQGFFEAGGGAPPLTRERHRENLIQCRDFLQAALDSPLPELAAEDLRQALQALGRITGRVDVEQLLDVVFKDFCIGK